MQILARIAMWNYRPIRSITRGLGLWAIFLGMSAACGGEDIVHSNPVEVSGIEYTVINQNGELSLRTAATRGNEEASSAPIKGIPRQTSPITALKLGRWWKRSLALVYATKTEADYHYTLAVFPSVESQKIVPTVWQKEFLKAETLYDFIVIEGQFSGDTIVVVLGSFFDENGIRKFSHGYVYNNECPRPPEFFSLTPIGNPK